MYIPKFYEVLFGVYIYALKLRGGKFYVGITRDPKNRFRDHRAGKTSPFVRQNLPVKKIRFKLLDSTDWKVALKEETKLTARLMEKYGVENVYGGTFTGSLKMREAKFRKYKMREE